MQQNENRFKSFFVSKSPWTFAFVIVLLGGAYLRLRALAFQSYWNDELFSSVISDPENNLKTVIKLTVQDVHPPLFQVLLWFWFKIVGFSEISGRIFPAIFGILSIPVMFMLGSAVDNRRTGFICGFICSVNIFHLHYSQEVRSYSLLFFLSAMSTLLIIRIIQGPKRIDLAAYVTITAAMAYTHFFGLFLLIAQAIFFLTKIRTNNQLKRTGIIIGAALLFALLPLIPIVIKNSKISAFWIKQPAPDFAIAYFQEYFGSSLIALSAALIIFWGLTREWRTSEKGEVIKLLVLSITVVLVLPYIRSLMSTPMLTTRNTIVALPAIFTLTAMGFSQIADRGLQLTALGVFGVLSLLLIFHQPPYYRTVTKPQIREATQALISAKPDPQLVYAPPEVVKDLNIYLAWLNASFRVQPVEDLYRKYNDTNGSTIKFWFIDGRVGPLFDQITRDSRVHVLQKADFFEAGFRVMELTN